MNRCFEQVLLFIVQNYPWVLENEAKHSFGDGRVTLCNCVTRAKSPLYGCDSYLAVGAVFRKTYISTTVPSHILKGIGTIVSKPPGIGQFSGAMLSIGKRSFKKGSRSQSASLTLGTRLKSVLPRL